LQPVKIPGGLQYREKNKITVPFLVGISQNPFVVIPTIPQTVAADGRKNTKTHNTGLAAKYPSDFFRNESYNSIPNKYPSCGIGLFPGAEFLERQLIPILNTN
jgi:hypothetical protein